ncbi:MFS transporter [Phormidium tenue FACHB-886]|nr:MFS transporter [Phormidium tenue FACHB-886]
MANIIKQPCDEGVIQSLPCPSPCAPNAKPWILAATILGSSMAMIDGSVVNVALPIMQAKLNATSSDVQWIVESYALFLAALILVGGSLGDHLGRRRIFAAGIALFALASAWCGLAPNVTQLILARAVQGIGGAMLVPGSLAIISASFERSQRGQAIGTWSGFTAITSALGPVLGGWLVENASWRWIFFINLPMAAIVLAIIFWHVPESRDASVKGKLDSWGALLVTLGLGSIVYGLIEASHLGLLHPAVLIAIAIGTAALVGFVQTEGQLEAQHRSPMMPLSLFRSSTFSGANLLTLFLYAAMGGVIFFFPFNLVQVQGYSATAAGAAFLPLILLMFFLSRWSGGLVNRYGAKRPLTVGPVIAACGLALFAVPGVGGSYWTTFFPAILILGVGMAVSVAPLSIIVMAVVPAEQAGVASGINNAVARGAGLLSVAVLSLVVAGVFNRALDLQLAQLQIPTDLQQFLELERINLAAAAVPANLDAALQVQLKQAIAAAFVSGFRVANLIAAGLALLGAVVAQWMIQPLENS